MHHRWTEVVRQFISMPVVLAGLCLHLFVLGVWANAAERADRLSILLIMADDQGWGDLGYNGHPVLRTPNLDAMAAAGLRFDRFYAAAPVCSPTRGSVLTGRHPNRFACFQWGHAIRPQEVTLAHLLKRAGYATGHFGKWHLGSVRSGSPVNPGAVGFDRWLSAENFYDNDPILSREGRAVQLTGESSMIAAEAAVDFMSEQVKAGRPFLAVVWFGSPHSPHSATDKDRSLYAGQGQKADFYGEISGIDRAVGRLRSALRDMKVHESTLVWYCSDNGALPNVGVSGGRGHKAHIYEGGLRVPAIVEWPSRIRSPRVTASPASTSDIFPTVLEAAGVSVPRNRPLDGLSLLPVIDGTSEARPEPIGFWNYPQPGTPQNSEQWMAELLEAQRDGREPDDAVRLRLDAGTIANRYPLNRFPGHAAWLEWPWKLHRIETKDKSLVRLELYNLVDDTQEARDLVSEDARRGQTMRQQLERWQASVVRSLNGNDYAAH